MTAASIKGQILENVAARLATITQVNGYSTDVKKVYSDRIPMGIELRKDQVPCIFLIDAPDNITMQHSCVRGDWDMRLQLWHNSGIGDIIMMDFVRNVFKAIYANSPTAATEQHFRGIHASIYELIPLSISPDLNMIEANRIIELTFLVRYSTQLYNL